MVAGGLGGMPHNIYYVKLVAFPLVSGMRPTLDNLKRHEYHRPWPDFRF